MLHLTSSLSGRGGAAPRRCIILHVHQLNVLLMHCQTQQLCICTVKLSYSLPLCVLTVVDRRGESEESGDDETRRRSINGDVDPNQPTATSKSSHLKH